MAVRPPQPGPPTPDPVREIPPDDRFCDLILNGGVASGVVYPWAVVELARRYRFRRIGGNSVGAMAAALAAAAEYGRCCSNPDAFEVLRRTPGDLAEEDAQGRTQMLRLFQPPPALRRLFECFLIGVRHLNSERNPPSAWLLTLRDIAGEYGLGGWWLAGVLLLLLPALALTHSPVTWGLVLLVPTVFLVASERVAHRWGHSDRGELLRNLFILLAAAHVLAAVFLCVHLWFHVGPAWSPAGVLPLLGALGWVLVVVALGLFQLWPELCALVENGYGLCSGKAQPEWPGAAPRELAIVEWLHKGIQLSAAREHDDPPLTFRDLWNAPRAGLPTTGCPESISLEMFSTNITLGRPVLWPLRDPNARLFFRREEWEPFLPAPLLEAVCKVARPYAPATDSDPPAGDDTADFLEVPGADLPIAIAARLSLSFPFLFSFIPVYAVDYSQKPRALRQCQLTDGGLCTNFPIHLFDSAHPRWPTFGLMLSRRISIKEKSVWLPKFHMDGRADNWLRAVPGAEGRRKPPLMELLGLLTGMVSSALEWNDNLIARLPHVRNRVLRMGLRKGEGQLNIAMPGTSILRMAHEYGTQGGRLLVRRFVSDNGVPRPAWREHLYIRALNELGALTEHLRAYAEAVESAGFTEPLASILAEASKVRPLRAKPHRPEDPWGGALTPAQAAALQEVVERLAELSQLLVAAAPSFGPYDPMPSTRSHLRSRI